MRIECSATTAPTHRLEPESRGESVRRAEELDSPGQLPGDPEAGADAFPWSQVAGCGVVEALACIDDLADEPPLGAAHADIFDATAVPDGVRGDLGGGEQHVQRLRLAHLLGVELAGEPLPERLDVAAERE